MSPRCKVKHRCHAPRKRGIQYAAAVELGTAVSGILDRPVKPGDDSFGWVGDDARYAAADAAASVSASTANRSGSAGTGKCFSRAATTGAKKLR
ncbi:hypothetical protein ACVIGA_006492 [Bradyrhizobium sp. USDA 3240]